MASSLKLPTSSSCRLLSSSQGLSSWSFQLSSSPYRPPYGPVWILNCFRSLSLRLPPPRTATHHQLRRHYINDGRSLSIEEWYFGNFFLNRQSPGCMKNPIS